MPAAVVKGKAQEKQWEAAKKAAGSTEKDPKYALVMHIFTKMRDAVQKLATDRSK